MTANSNRSIDETRNDGLHAFPALDRAYSTGNKAQENSRDCFKPLFSNACTHQGGIGRSQPGDDLPNDEDQASRRGFEKGLDAGRHDACKLARQEMTPEIKALSVDLKQLNQSLDQIVDSSCRQIMKMAHSIAGSILSAAPGIEMERLSGLKEDLKKQLIERYQLKIKLDPDNMETLSDFMACEYPDWRHGIFVQLDGDSQVPNGSLESPPNSQIIPEDSLVLEALDRLLDGASTK